MHQPVWTNAKARLLFQRAPIAGRHHWLFLPGGPGLGSESLLDLTQDVRLPGSLWHVDLPQDGSNRFDSYQINLENWQQALLESVQVFEQPILVAHSFGAMLALTIPKLGDYLKGLVLLNTAPSSKWIAASRDLMEKHQLPDPSTAKQEYKSHPTDEGFKHFTLDDATMPYFFTTKGQIRGRVLMDQLPYNHVAYDWAGTQFHPHYQAIWIPECPTLILGSEHDYLTPLELFYESSQFLRSNITFSHIPNAGHFPWIENFIDVQKALQHFYEQLKEA
ncbi:MAG: alpha/beta hydrolase [Gammaproteobacteria bacterium]